MRKLIQLSVAIAVLACTVLPPCAEAQDTVRWLNWPGKVNPVTPPSQVPLRSTPISSLPIASIPASSVPVQTVPSPETSSDVYQVPPSSRYASRIAKARAHQAASAPVVTMAPIPDNVASVPKTAPESVPESASEVKATAPTPGAPLAAEQTDHVFIPGELITNDATQRPRFYSLHRQYGMTPDAIEVPQGDNNALLEVPYETEEQPEQNFASDTIQP